MQVADESEQLEQLGVVHATQRFVAGSGPKPFSEQLVHLSTPSAQNEHRGSAHAAQAEPSVVTLVWPDLHCEHWFAALHSWQFEGHCRW